MTGTAALERILRRDRLVVAASLLAVTLLAWFYLLRMAAEMPGMSVSLEQLASLTLQPWDASYFLMIFLMWAVMMVGMMLPTAAPTILIFARATRQNPGSASPVLRSYLFALGYLLTWTVFSLGATLLQWGVENVLPQSPRIAHLGPMLGGAVLVLAGVYQWTPLKDNCLKKCRGPMDFLTRHWRRSLPGASWMGIQHGLYCVGCCWVLMLLLFVGGVMNLLWIAAITAFVLIEKLLPHGAQVGRLSGALLIVAGSFMLLRG